ncbi:MAG: lipid-A-disaccharide synthase N-terminal domain-containing protein, partial [Bacteroidales bacterium]
MDHYLVIGLGLIAQGLFSARFIIQLTRSEIAGKVVSPVVFWQLSLLASFMLIIYGFLRNDIVIIGGQLVSYYIYIRNLQLKHQWKIIPSPLRYLFS